MRFAYPAYRQGQVKVDHACSAHRYAVGQALKFSFCRVHWTASVAALFRDDEPELLLVAGCATMLNQPWPADKKSAAGQSATVFGASRAGQ
jgi:hypothetical protein